MKDTTPDTPYTCRENELFKRLDDACQDYTDEEILKAVGRKLHWMSYDPCHQVTAPANFQAVTGGHQAMRFNFMVGMTAEQALAWASGAVANIVANYAQRWPNARR